MIIPAAAVGFTLYYFSTIIDSPWEAQVNAFFIGTILIALVAVIVATSVWAAIKGEADWRLENLISPSGFVPKRLALLALTFAYILGLEWGGGFTLTTFVFLVAAMALLNNGQRLRLILGLSACLALGGYVMFILAFETRFAAGPFEWLVQALF